jgi:hypothetical protein
MLEKVVEAKVNAYAQSKGFLTYKFTSPARRAVPDRIYISPKGTVLFVEFKREGQKPTPPQEREHHRLRMQNVNVFVIDYVEAGEFMVDMYA